MERFLPWDNFGTQITEYKDSTDTLEKAGLNWEVETKPIFYEGEERILKNVPKKMAVVRKDTQDFISEIDFNRNVINNKDAFNFLDLMIKEYGGELTNIGFDEGKATSYAFLNMGSDHVLGDQIDHYLVVANNFGGDKSPLQISFEPLRVVCTNQLNSLYKSQSTIKFMVAPKEEAQRNLIENIFKIKNKSVEKLEKEANELVKLHYSKDQFYQLVEQLYPTSRDLDLTNCKRNANEYMASKWLNAYNQEDLNNFRETVWGALNSLVDFIGHTQSYRDDKNNKEWNHFKSLEIMKTSIAFIAYVKSLMIKQATQKSTYGGF